MSTTTATIPAAAHKPLPCPADPRSGDVANLYDHGTIEFTTPDGKRHPFEVEIARTPAAQERGMMYRTHLDRTRGMLFDFAEAHPASFWMRNTCIPLDMIFIGESKQVIGVITAPPLNEAPRSVPGFSKYVVELAAGVAQERRIAIGTTLTIASPGQK